ncbi:hypothetical protein P7C73_g164, partial [Tremellales sp. Uapishka_1]
MESSGDSSGREKEVGFSVFDPVSRVLYLMDGVELISYISAPYTTDHWLTLAPQHLYLEDRTHLQTSPQPISDRRLSTTSTTVPREKALSGLYSHIRQRSTSTASTAARSPSSPVHHVKPRPTRTRAPTLAGEALEGGEHLHGIEQQKERVERETRRLVRCFVVLKLPPRKVDQPGSVPLPKDRPTKQSKPPKPISRQSSSQSLTPPTNRPPVSRTPTPTTSPPASSPARTASLTSPSSSGSPGRLLSAAITKETSSNGQGSKSGLSRSESLDRKTRTGLPSPRGSFRGGVASISRINGKAFPSPPIVPPTTPAISESDLAVPFYISPVSRSTTNPRFLCLSPETDFAPWLTVGESASSIIDLELWIEESAIKWIKVESLGGRIDLRDLRRITPGEKMLPNTIQFTLSSDPRVLFYLPKVMSNGDGEKTNVDRGVVERSLRETRMKRGPGVGGLHQLVNMQAVIMDTERSVEDVKKGIDRLLLDDADWSSLRRDVHQREEQVRWIKEKIEEVEKATKEGKLSARFRPDITAQAKAYLRRQAIDNRRDHLLGAEDGDELLGGRAIELASEIYSVDQERLALLPLIHSRRAYHVQTLDSLFPILPLSPSTLLYTILNVPLPIPLGPKDPAPPLTLPSHPEISERTTATALGYVAMVVQFLGNLNGPVGGIPYPVTCAGSRSLVRDIVSVMQGPRSQHSSSGSPTHAPEPEKPPAHALVARPAVPTTNTLLLKHLCVLEIVLEGVDPAAVQLEQRDFARILGRRTGLAYGQQAAQLESGDQYA